MAHMNKNIITLAIVALVLVAGGSFLYLYRTASTQSAANQAISNKLVEIFYLPHPPAQAIVDKVDPIIAKFPRYAVEKYDFLNPDSEEKIKEYNLVNHAPITIFINGINTFTLNDKTISLSNFPKGDAFMPTFEGDWGYADLEQILKDQQ